MYIPMSLWLLCGRVISVQVGKHKKNYQGTLREILTDVTTVTLTAGL